MGNSLGRAPWGRSDTEATGGWTKGKLWEPWEIAWGTRAPLGRSDTEATRGWTEGKPWEIALGQLHWEGAIQKGQEGGRRGSVGNSLGRAPLGRSDTEATTGWTEGKREK